MKVLSLLLFLTLILYSCDQNDDLFDNSSIGRVNFEYHYNGDCTTPILEVVFTNKSQQLSSFHWDFGDGTISTDKEPIKVYEKSGEYVVTLTSFLGGNKFSVEKKIKILRNSDGNGPDLETTIMNGRTAFEKQFILNSNAELYSVFLGDGNVVKQSTINEFNYVFPGLGSYEVFIIAENAKGCSCAQMKITI